MDHVTATLLLIVASAWTFTTAERITSFPSLSLFEKALRTTAIHDFDGHDPAFQAAVRWDRRRLRDKFSHQHAPYLACAEYGEGREAMNRLKEFLSPEAVRPASNTAETGACFIVTASNAQATSISAHGEQFWLLSVGPVPSALKLAPGLLDHNNDGSSSERLATTHGKGMRMANVVGLNVELAPGTLRMHAPEAMSFAKSLLEDLASKSLDLQIGNVWSDPTMVGADHHPSNGGAWRAREWIRAADVVEELTEAVDTSPSDICSWDSTAIHQASDNVLTVSGTVNHQLCQYQVSFRVCRNKKLNDVQAFFPNFEKKGTCANLSKVSKSLEQIVQNVFAIRSFSG